MNNQSNIQNSQPTTTSPCTTEPPGPVPAPAPHQVGDIPDPPLSAAVSPEEGSKPKESNLSGARLFRRIRLDGPDIRWLQYVVIEDQRLHLIHMVRTMVGWNFGVVITQGEGDWLDMNRDAIAACVVRDWDPIEEIQDPKLLSKILARVSA